MMLLFYCVMSLARSHKVVSVQLQQSNTFNKLDILLFQYAILWIKMWVGRNCYLF